MNFSWIKNIWNIINMNKKFLNNCSFQDLMVLCCRKWWKLRWWYTYFSYVLNFFNNTKTGNISGSSCMWYSYSWDYLSVFVFFFINVYLYHFCILFPLFRTNYKLYPSFYHVLKRDISLPPSGKLPTLKPHESKNFLTCLYRVTPPFLLHFSENKNSILHISY